MLRDRSLPLALGGALLAAVELTAARVPATTVAVGVAVTATVALYRRPLVFLGAVMTGFVGHLALTGRQLPALGYSPNSYVLGAVFLGAVFAAGRAAPLVRALAGLVIASSAMFVLLAQTASQRGGWELNETLSASLFSVVVPWLAGLLFARQRKVRELAAERDRARAEAAAERSRVAREVHDVVAHSVSLMVVQAEAGEALLDHRPERARESLRAVQSAGRQALGELRRTLAAIRPEAGPLPLAPTPGLAALDELVTSVRGTGLAVEVCREGEPVTLPAGVDLSAYRIVQEALTNALRHSDRSGAHVTVRYEPGRVTLEVATRGRAADRGLSAGHGLAGLRERVAMLGGSLEVVRDAGAHVVRAVLPLPTA